MRTLLKILILVAIASPVWANPLILMSGPSAAPVAGYVIEDHFGSDTSANYTNIGGTLSISGGAAHGTAGLINVAYHETATGSNDHWASGTCNAAVWDSACLILGSNGTQYYYVEFQNGTIYVRDTAANWSASYAGSYSGTYTVVAQIDTDGSNHARLNIWVDGVQRITNQSDAGDNVTRGQYVGTRIDNDTASGDVAFDDLIANSGAYTP